MQISTVVFDLDGTLIDTAPGVLNAVEYTVQKIGKPPLSKDTILKFIGPPIKDSLQKYCCLTEEIAVEATAIFRTRYSKVDLYKAVVYEGIFDVLKELKRQNIKIGVATYKREDYAIKLLEQKGMSNYFQSINGADDEGIKSKQDILEECICKLQTKSPQNAVLIGDTLHDAEGALKAKTYFIGVTYGYGFTCKGEIPSTKNFLGTADTAYEILRFFRGNYGGCGRKGLICGQ